MIIHIVREHERLQDILKNYNVEIDDLKTNNLHITDFNHLTPGTKLRIPNLNLNFYIPSIDYNFQYNSYFSLLVSLFYHKQE